MGIQLSVIVPVYNESLTAKGVLEELRRLASVRDWEIIVVDDGSNDNSSLLPYEGIRLLKHRHNKGYGAALKTGIRNARGESIAIIDADGQHNPHDIERMSAKQSEFDMVIGMRARGSYLDPERIIGKKIITALAEFLVQKKIFDLNSGLRIVRKDILMKYLHLLPNGFSASSTMTLIFLCENYDVGWTPITTEKRKGKSSLRLLRDGYNSLILVIRIVSLFNPLRLFFPISIFLILTGIVYGIYKVITVKLTFPVGGFIFIFLGVMSLFLGILLDQVSDLRKEIFERNEP